MSFTYIADMFLPHYSRNMPRYFVTTDHRGEREVSKQDYVKVERQAGFNNTMDQPNEPATSAFSHYGHGCDPRISGRIDYGRTKEEK